MDLLSEQIRPVEFINNQGRNKIMAGNARILLNVILFITKDIEYNLTIFNSLVITMFLPCLYLITDIVLAVVLRRMN
jgi:hypothetical protein